MGIVDSCHCIAPSAGLCSSFTVADHFLSSSNVLDVIRHFFAVGMCYVGKRSSIGWDNVFQ